MNAITPDGPVLGELASRLQADQDGSVRREYCEMFLAAKIAARKRLHEPLMSEEFETHAAVAAGADLSIEVISTVWSALHSR